MNSEQNLNEDPGGGSELNDGLEAVREQLNILAPNGNWNYSPYMHGMYNGVECALATLEGRGPYYRNAPEQWICDKASDGFAIEIERLTELEYRLLMQ